MAKQIQDNLDLEFKNILCEIRQHIPHVNSNAYLMQCRLWLEKLSCSNTNKKFRNAYLAELCKQIRINKLLPPFNEAPPRGEIKKPIRKLNLEKPQVDNESQTLDKEVITQSPSLCNIDNNCESSHSDEAFHGVVKKLKITVDEDTTRQKLPDTPDISCGEPMNKPEGSLSPTESKQITDDSWSDLTEESSDNEFHQVKLSPSNKQIQYTENNKKQESNDISTRQHENFRQSENEIQLESTQKFMNDTNYISQDWKQTIAALQLRLSEMTLQNNELNIMNQKLEVELEHIRANNRVQCNQEIAKLKEIHEEQLFRMEGSFKASLEDLAKDYEKRMLRISSSYEQQISEFKKQNEEIINKKDGEISRLSEIIQEQCLRIMNDISTIKNQVTNCSCEKKVHVLKKCVSKMDKLFQKSEKVYIKKIETLKQELEVKESALQVQLKIQKAELITQTRTGQKEEFEEILNALEIKYIRMLEGHEHQIMRMKKHDDDKIEYLTELLEKHGITYDDNFEYNNNDH